MNDSSHPYEDPQLGRQLKALAGALLKDEAAAEDIVQEVWLASLKMPPSSYSDGKAWLMAVTKNLARSEIRSRVHRRDREQSAASPEASLESTSTIEQASVRERLVEAVRGLGSPYSEVVYARFIEESTPAEIAENDGCSLATIRTRLHRGIKRLRARLDAEYGGSAAFGIALIGAFDWSPGDLGESIGAGSGSGTPTRGLLGGTSPVAIAVAAMIAAAGVFVAVAFLRTDGDGRDGRSELEELAGGVSDQSDQVGKVGPDFEPTTQVGGADRVALDEEPSAESVASEATDGGDIGANVAAADPDSGVVVITVVDENSVRVPGARILVVQDMLGTVRATTDNRGNASVAWTMDDLTWVSSPEFADAGANRLTLVAQADGFAASMQLGVIPSELEGGRVGLAVRRPACSIFGRVLGPDGRGVEGARVSAMGGAVARGYHESRVYESMSIDTLSGPGGGYRLHGVSPEERHVFCRVPGVGVAFDSFDRDGNDWGEIELDLQLTPGASVRGTLKTGGGIPLEGVEVSYEVRNTSSPTTISTLSGPDGTYHLQGLPPLAITIGLRGAGMDRYARLRLRAGEETRHDETLAAGRSFAVSVVDLDGEPIEWAWVGSKMPRSDWGQALRTNADGEVTFVDHPPVGGAREGSLGTESIIVTVKGNAPSGALILMGAVEMTSIGPDPLVIQCNPDFSDLRTVIGGIVDHTGAAPTDSWVFLSGAWPHPLMSTDVRASDGSFQSQDIRQGPYDVFVRAPGAHHFYLGSIDVESDPTDVGLLKLPEPARVHIEWAWGDDGRAVRFQIHEEVAVGAVVMRGMVAGGDRDRRLVELLPGSYIVHSFSRSGAKVEQRALHCRSGVDVTVSLGPDSPQRCLVTVECDQVEATELEVTVHALFDVFVAPDATDEELEEICLDSELVFDGTAQRIRGGSYQFDYEFVHVGSYISRFVAPDGRVTHECSLLREFRQLSCLDDLKITFD